VSELELLRQAFDATPEPAASSVRVGRAALLREVELGRERRRRRSWSAPVLVAIVAALTAVAFLLVPRGNGLTGTGIAAAASDALVPRSGGIWHIVEVVNNVPGPSSRAEIWATTSRPYVIHMKTTQPGAALVEEARTACGSVYQTQGTITFSVRPLSLQAWIERPTRDYRRALRDKHIRYAGETTVGDVRAYKLVQTIPIHGSATYRVGGVVTTLVRRGSYYPLETVGVYTHRILENGRWHSSVDRETIAYPTFQLLPRDAGTEPLLQIKPQPDVFVIPDQSSKASARCRRDMRSLLRHP
jgi:hypothetical protein